MRSLLLLLVLASTALTPVHAESGAEGWLRYAPITDPASLHRVFHLLDLVARQQPLPSKPTTESPSSPVRWVNQWDNLNGTIERGYAGRSIFYDNGHVRSDLTRVSEYGRLLASVGLNGATV